MGGCVVYSYARGRLDVRAVAASYASRQGYDFVYFTFTFRDPSKGAIDYRFVRRGGHYMAFSYNTGLINLPKITNRRNIHAGDVLQVSIRAFSAGTDLDAQVASVTLTLYPGGLNCPALGTSAWPDEATGQC